MDQHLKDLKQNLKTDHGESWKYWQPICDLIQRVHDLEIELHDERELNRPDQKRCAEEAKFWAEKEAESLEQSKAIFADIKAYADEIRRNSSFGNDVMVRDVSG